MEIGVTETHDRRLQVLRYVFMLYLGIHVEKMHSSFTVPFSSAADFYYISAPREQMSNRIIGWVVYTKVVLKDGCSLVMQLRDMQAVLIFYKGHLA